jgi:hypothetical protein
MSMNDFVPPKNACLALDISWFEEYLLKIIMAEASAKLMSRLTLTGR